jgi:DeoR/GlpR family transcriptional regulator of sugar metabolism
MLTRQRHHAILTLLDRRGAVTAAELADEFGVSGVTIRRDLIDLDGRGLLHRVHGGAVRMVARRPAPTAPDPADAPDPARLAIARLAAATVRPGSAIALSAGPTALAMASQLPAVGGLTVITNSVPVAAAASRTIAQPALMLIGGQATSRGAHVGPLAHAAIKSVHIQTLYLDVHGFHTGTGFTVADLLEADIDRALVRSAQHIVVLAHHRTWGRVGIRTIAPLDRADTVISDDGLPAATRHAVTGRVGQLLIAEAEPR